MEPPTRSSSQYSPTCVTIDLDNLRHNARQLQRFAHPATLVAVIKANAYGHGATQVAKTLSHVGIERFAVATLPEGIRLREAGIEEPIQVFAAPLPDYAPAYAAHHLDVTIASVANAETFIERARQGDSFSVHVKVDTGMGRLGLAASDVASVLSRLQATPNIHVSGLWTHFAQSGTPDDPFTRQQWNAFESLEQHLGTLPPVLHATNSGALRWLPESYKHSDRLVRSGISLYGIAHPQDEDLGLDLRPVMTFTSRITHIKTVSAGTSISYGRRWVAQRESRIATIGAGYADGYRRVLTNRAAVQIGARRYPVAGTVCMDMFMVDLGTPSEYAKSINVGDSVVLFGNQGPTVREVATWAETIPYEILCGISGRVPRIYTDNSGAT